MDRWGSGPSPTQKAIFAFFARVRPCSKPGQTTWPQVCGAEHGPGPRRTDEDKGWAAGRWIQPKADDAIGPQPAESVQLNLAPQRAHPGMPVKRC